MTFKHVGKQVLRDGRHFADAATVEIAAMIVEAMNAQEREGDE